VEELTWWGARKAITFSVCMCFELRAGEVARRREGRE